MSLRNQKILFFIAGIVPTAVEADLITRLLDQAADVKVRSLLQSATFGSRAESCDGIAIVDEAGIPSAYSDAEDFPIVTPGIGGTSISVANDDAVDILSAAGTKQVETATAAGTITARGTVAVVITSAGMTGSPLTLQVQTEVGDTAAQWAAKVRAALAANLTIATRFTVSGSTTAIVLTCKVAAANDATLNIALADGTSTGVTTAASSADTTAGVAKTVLDTGKAVVASGSFVGVLQDNPA